MTAETISAVAAVASALSAIIAVWVAYRSVKLSDKALTAQERHNQLSLKPIPFLALADYEHQIRVKITNDGAGPLIVRSVGVSDNSKKSHDVISWMPAPPEGIYWTNFTSLLSGRAILPNNGLTLLELAGDPDDSQFAEFRDKCRKTLASLTVRLEYVDIHDGTFDAYERRMDWFARAKGTRS